MIYRGPGASIPEEPKIQFTGHLTWKSGTGDDRHRWVELIITPDKEDMPKKASFPYVSFRFYIGPDDHGDTGFWRYPQDIDIRLREWLDLKEEEKAKEKETEEEAG